jgi:hypothetical protein
LSCVWLYIGYIYNSIKYNGDVSLENIVIVKTDIYGEVQLVCSVSKHKITQIYFTERQICYLIIMGNGLIVSKTFVQFSQ